MSRETQTKVLFLSVLAGTGLLYGLTAAHGYPWSASTHWALAWSGVLPELPYRLHPIWGYLVQMFGGHYIALSIVGMSLAVALLAASVTRHMGWRVGAAAAIALAFTPRFWNAAVVGERGASVLAFGAAVLWLLDTWVTALVSKYRSDAVLSHRGETGKRARWWRITAWSLLVVSCLFAAGSLTYHDYAIGEDASAYVQEVLQNADGKWLVMSGVTDDQFYAEVHDSGRKVELLSLRRDDLYRKQLVERIKAAFPDEHDLLLAAEIGPQAFVAAARKAHPDLFVMTDMDRLLERIGKNADELKARRRRPAPIEKLVEWNNEMVRAMDSGDLERAGTIARSILSVPQWSTFVPANAVMGTLTGMEGDLKSSERFFRNALKGNGDPPVVLYNDFAETLRQLGKLDEAEKFARKAVELAGENGWSARFTLIQVLLDANGNPDEVSALIKESLKCAPESVRPKFQEFQKRFSQRYSVR